MAPRTRTAGDGAKPGTEVEPSTNHAVDVDGRAKAREEAVITIGGRDLHRVRKNWPVTRKLRGLLRDQGRASSRSDRFDAEVDALTAKIRGVPDENGGWAKEPITDEAELERIDARIAELEEKADAAQDESDEIAYRLIGLLLRDENGALIPLADGADNKKRTAESVEFLKNELDATDAGDLAIMLSANAGPLADPTPIPTSSD